MNRNALFVFGLIVVFAGSFLLWHLVTNPGKFPSFRKADPNHHDTTCVAWNTDIATPTGPKTATEISVGDDVFSVNVTTGERVTTTVVNKRKGRRRVGQLTTPHGTLWLTDDHPVYDPLTDEYAPAMSWFQGDRSVVLAETPNGISRVSVSSVSPTADETIVYDFTVESEFKNFIAEGIVVHNKTMF